MAITRTAMVDDDGTGTTGTVINNAWKQQLYDQIDAADTAMGTWTSVPYNAANFTASAGTWVVAAGDVAAYQYALIGKILLLNFFLNTTTVTGSPATLRLALPAGLIAASGARSIIQVLDAGTQRYGMASAGAGLAYIELYSIPAGTPWVTATDTTYVIGQIFLPVT
jgi:hypothetical protein